MRKAVLDAIGVFLLGAVVFHAGVLFGHMTEFCGSNLVWRGECPEVAP